MACLSGPTGGRRSCTADRRRHPRRRARRAEWSRARPACDSGAAALALRDAGGGRQRLLVQPAPLSAAGVRASLLSSPR